jgi:hypothetical protein
MHARSQHALGCCQLSDIMPGFLSRGQPSFSCPLLTLQHRPGDAAQLRTRMHAARSIQEQYEVENYFSRSGTIMPKKYTGYYIGYNKTSPDVSVYDWQVKARGRGTGGGMPPDPS